MFLIGMKAKVYDPLKNKFRDATIIRHYGYLSHTMHKIMGGPLEVWRYPDLVDVQFDDRISKGHFTSGIEIITPRCTGTFGQSGSGKRPRKR